MGIFIQKSNQQDVEETLSLINQFEYERGILDFKKTGIAQGLRIIAYQQFWYQDYIANHSFDRQFTLYVKLSSSFNIDQEFQKLSGFDIVKFLNICYMSFIYLNHDKLGGENEYDGIFHSDIFSIFPKKFNDKEIARFIKLLTIADGTDVKSIQKMIDEAYQMYETNFLITKPFIFSGGQYRIPHRSVFGQTCKHFIYDYMKANCSGFTTEFGKRLERYLELGLKNVGLSYKNENDLKQEYRLTKVVDFLIEEIILVECKAIELHPRTGIIRTSEILTSDLESSLVKAYKQLLSTASKIDPSKIYYGLIVTYKETYCGFGNDAWKEFLEKPIKEYILNEGIDLSVLPPEKLCFIDIESWDHLMQAVKEKQADIKEIIDKAIASNQSENPADKIMLFEQALKRHFYIKRLDLSFLNEAHNLIDIG